MNINARQKIKIMCEHESTLYYRPLIKMSIRQQVKEFDELVQKRRNQGVMR